MRKTDCDVKLSLRLPLARLVVRLLCGKEGRSPSGWDPSSLSFFWAPALSQMLGAGRREGGMVKCL